MSLINIGVSPSGQRAFVGADTIALCAGEKFSTTKLLAVPHLHCVVGGVGLAFTHRFIFGAALQAPSLETFCEWVPSLIDEAGKQRRAITANEGGCTPETLEQERGTVLAVVGYSQKDRRIVARVWNGFDSEDPAHAVVDIVAGYRNPDDGRFTGMVPLTPGEMENIARRQVVEFADYAKAKGMVIGGRLILADITERGIHMRDIADLESDIGAPAADTSGVSCRAAVMVRG